MTISLAEASGDMPVDCRAPRVPHLTTTPGVGGVIKQRPVDFIVTEAPTCDIPAGGEHMWLKVRATGMPHGVMVRHIQKACGVKRSAIGFLGIKDTHAVTTQVISVHHPANEPPSGPLVKGLEILGSGRTSRKFRPGGCANAFVIRIRGVRPGGASTVSRTLWELQERGLPNAFGLQRFGVRGLNHLLGRDLLVGDWEALLARLLLPRDGEESITWRAAHAEGDAKAALQAGIEAMGGRGESELPALRALARGRDAQSAVDAIPRSIKRFWVDALQAVVFNEVLAARIQDGTSHVLLLGDVPHDRGDGRMMEVIGDDDRLRSLRQRHQQGDIVGTGPLWSPTMRAASHSPGSMEVAAIERWIGDVVSLGDSRWCPGGARRPLHHALDEIAVRSLVDDHGPAVEVRFTLPAGGYATSVLDEIMKVPSTPDVT